MQSLALCSTLLICSCICEILFLNFLQFLNIKSKSEVDSVCVCLKRFFFDLNLCLSGFFSWKFEPETWVRIIHSQIWLEWEHPGKARRVGNLCFKPCWTKGILYPIVKHLSLEFSYKGKLQKTATLTPTLNTSVTASHPCQNKGH